MRLKMRRWVTAKAEDETLLDQHGPQRFAVYITLRVVFVANVTNMILHCLLRATGLLPYPLKQALIFGCLTTSVIAGAVGYLFGYFIGDAIREVSIRRDVFKALSSIDPLSGLLNRRAFFGEADGAASGSLIIFDIDFFKKINDKYGHQTGDEVIRHVAVSLTNAFTAISSRIARIGGEEFAVHTVSTDHLRVAQIAETAIASIAASEIQVREHIIRVTVSGGVAGATDQCSFSELYARADNALYLAKAAGRNRIVNEMLCSTSDIETENEGSNSSVEITRLDDIYISKEA